MKGKFVEFVRNLRDPVRARRQEKIREVELTWSDHDLSNFRVFALGLQPAEMADVCHALADGSAVPLLELLVDYAEANSELMLIAFQSLGKTPLSARLFLSGRLLASKDSMVRSNACKMLDGAAAAAEKLEAALDDESELVAASALRSLVSIGRTRAEKKLLALLAAGSAEMRILVIDSLIRLRISPGAFEKELLRILADPGEKPEVRRKAASALAETQSDEGCALLIRQLEDTDSDEEIRRIAAGALGGFSRSGVASALLETVKGGPYLLANAALQSLSGMDPAVTVPECVKALEGDDPAKAMAAAELLGGMHREEAARALEQCLRDETRPARIAAIAEALGKSGGKGAWQALLDKLAACPEEAIPLTASLADCAAADRMDEFASLLDRLPQAGVAELVLRRLAAFCRTEKPSPAVLRRALDALDTPNHIMAVSAVEILAYSGEPSMRRRVLTEMAGFGKDFPTRRLLRVLLRSVNGELATLFAGLGAEVSVLVPEAAAEAESMGRGGVDFFVSLASWVRRDRLRAKQGLAAAATLDPDQLVEAMLRSPDRVCLLDAWAGLPQRERLRCEPDLDHLFSSCDEADRMRALETLSGIGEERHLRTVAMIAFNERDAGIKQAAVALVKRLVGADAGSDGKRGDG